MNPDLFPIPESKPPLLDTLRKAYDEAERELREAITRAELMGIGYNGKLAYTMEAAERALLAEEARLASIK